MNEVATTTGGLPANVADMAKALRSSASDAGAAAGGEVYLKFSKGDWSFGVEEEDPGDSEWAINPLQFAHGYIAWGREGTQQAGRVLGERLVSATEPLPAESDLPDVDGEWSKVVAIELKCVSGDAEGTQVIFKTNSLGGRQLYSNMIEAVAKQIENDPENVVPIVTLGSGSYKNAKYGKIFTPQMSIERWVSMEGPAEDDDSDAEEASTKTPARRSRAAAS